MQRKPHSFKKEKPFFYERNFWLVFFISLLLISLAYLLLISNIFQVKDIKIEGNNDVSSEDIGKIAEKEIKKNLIFTETKTIFLVSENIIKEEALKGFPKISKISIDKTLPGSLSINIIERLPVAFWCNLENCFSLDEEGVAFEEEGLLAESQLPIIQSFEEGAELILGQNIMTKDDFSKILKMNEVLNKELNIPIEKFFLSNDKLEVITREGFSIYTSIKSDIDWQMTKLEAVLAENIPLEKRKYVEYIDLRFGNFAPFKYKSI